MMQELYRISVRSYGFDSWDIFTEDENVFNSLTGCYSDNEAIEALGQERWEEIADNYIEIKYPYVLLGETELRQYD